MLGIRDVQKYKAVLDAALLARNFHVVRSTVFAFARPLPVASGGALYPYYDAEGRQLQIFDPEVTLEPVSITLPNEGSAGYGVFSWLEVLRARRSPWSLR
jgi:hypothetical protein